MIKEEARKMPDQKRKGDIVCLLRKGFYGLPQAGRAWNDHLDDEPRTRGVVLSK